MQNEYSMLLPLLVIVILFGLTIVGLGLRLQAELVLDQRAVRGLKIVSTVCFVFAGLICVGFGNIIGIVLGAIIVGRWAHFQMSRNWANQHAAELELIWLLALSVKSEESLVSEVEIYADGATGSRKRRLQAFVHDIQNGVPLQKCLPYDLFSRPTALQLQSAMNSDTFAESLARLAMAEGRALGEQHRDLGGSVLAYPIGLMLALTGICGFVMYYIIPKFKKIFEDFGTELPDMTIVAIHCSDFVVNYWYLGGVPLIAALAVGRNYLVNARHNSEAEAVVELLGGFFVRLHAPEILRALGMAISSGQSVMEGVKVFAQQPGPPLVQKTINAFIRRIIQGQQVWDELRDLGVLRRSEQKVIEAASRAGNLPWVLETLAENLERRWEFRFNVLGAFLHPILILVVSLPIAYFALAMFMPLVKLLNDLS